MRERSQIWHDFVAAIGNENENEILCAMMEMMLDIRELLQQKQKRKTLTTEMTLTPAEQALLDKLDQHGE